jgi:hypothetical protein
MTGKRWMAALCLVLGASAWSGADSLGDAARREQERRKKMEDGGKAPSRVLTEDDLPAKARPPVEATTAPPAADAAVRRPLPFIGAPGHARPGDDPASWAARRRELEADVRKAEADLAAASDQKRQEALAVRDGARRALSAFEEDARRQGIPSGWRRLPPASEPREAASVPATGEARSAQELEWRRRSAALRAAVEAAQWEYDSTRKPSVWSNGTRTKQDEAKARLAAARQARADLEEEARRTGIPPVWLR